MTTGTSSEFEGVLAKELQLLHRLRDDNDTPPPSPPVYQNAYAFNLAGLALSGGGIRSATFNLGVIQALSAHGLLSKFDYLSTVSGGGFIGGWLSALLHHKAKNQNEEVNQTFVESMEKFLQTHPTKDEEHTFDTSAGFPPVEHKAVRYLRRYSNYLSPRLGLSGDMLSVISIFLRNFVLIQLTLISLIASIVLLAHVMVIASGIFRYDLTTRLGFLGPIFGKNWPLAAAILPLFIAVWFAGRRFTELKSDLKKADSKISHSAQFSVIFPCLLSAWWFSAAIATHTRITDKNNIFPQLVSWAVCSGFAYCAAYVLGWVAERSRPARENKKQKEDSTNQQSSPNYPHKKQGKNFAKIALFTILVGCLLGALLYAIVYYFENNGETNSPNTLNIWQAVTFGPPLFLLILMFVVTLHIGLVGRPFRGQNRESLARLGGFLLLYATIWTFVFCLILYATPFVEWLAKRAWAALMAWATGSGIGGWLAGGPSTGNVRAGIKKWKDIIARIAPWLFIAGLMVIITYVTQLVLFKYLTDKNPIDPLYTPSTLDQLNQLSCFWTPIAMLGMFVVFAIFICNLDINLFSLHAMYKNRLARTYVAASLDQLRNPNLFSGFDEQDDLRFSELAQQRPIPIINTAINMTGGDDLAWQTRRAASFAFTPSWAGFETRDSQGNKIGLYRPTASYAAGLELGSLMAISGAAASPNMGYHTSPAVAALLTAFNLRLGRWCGNPVLDNCWSQKSPPIATAPFLAELTGSANGKANWINLTDGGHFENLGVYELVRRRCKLIVAVDAGCDPKYQYRDLANLLRLCWTDLGINIRFDNFDPMRPGENDRHHLLGAHGAVGRIQYPDNDEGAIIYIKASMTGDEWPDIRQYADEHEEFPQETTADQFFDENQFEAYRHLGYKAAATIFDDLKNHFGGTAPKDISIEDLVAKLNPHHSRAD